MIDWKFNIFGAVLILVWTVLSVMFEIFFNINVGYELIFGPVIIGMVVGYYRGNKFIDGFLNAFFAGCMGGVILGVLLYIVYLLAPYTDSYPGDLVVSPLVVLITGLFGMAVIFSFLSAVGGILGSLIKKLRGSNRYNEEGKNG